MNWLNDLPKLPKLSAGSHLAGSPELCAMELVAFMERLPHSDKPDCTCPIIGEFVRVGNDHMPDSERQKLLPILPELVGTFDSSLMLDRVLHLWDWSRSISPRPSESQHILEIELNINMIRSNSGILRDRALIAKLRAAAFASSYLTIANSAAGLASFVSVTQEVTIEPIKIDIWDSFRQELLDLARMSNPASGAKEWSRDRTLEAIAMQEEASA